MICINESNDVSYVMIPVYYTRELIGTFDAMGACGRYQNDGSRRLGSEFLHTLVESSEHLLLKLDESLREAREARSAMMTYIQVCISYYC
jgi:hypothetical protein